MYLSYDQNGAVDGIVSTYVDDLLGIGDGKAMATSTRQTYAVRRKDFERVRKPCKVQHDTSYDGCGAEIVRRDGCHDSFTHSNYGKKDPATIDQRAQQPPMHCDTSERRELRRLPSALQGRSLQSPTPLQASVSWAHGSQEGCTIQTLADAKKTLRCCKRNTDVGLDHLEICSTIQEVPHRLQRRRAGESVSTCRRLEQIPTTSHAT